MADTVNGPQPKDPPDNQGGGGTTAQANPESTGTADTASDTCDNQSDGESS